MQRCQACHRHLWHITHAAMCTAGSHMYCQAVASWTHWKDSWRTEPRMGRRSPQLSALSCNQSPQMSTPLCHALLSPGGNQCCPLTDRLNQSCTRFHPGCSRCYYGFQSAVHCQGRLLMQPCWQCLAGCCCLSVRPVRSLIHPGCNQCLSLSQCRSCLSLCCSQCQSADCRQDQLLMRPC